MQHYWRTRGKWILGVAWLAAIALLVLAHPAIVLAATWVPVAEASQGQQQQFVDVDSITVLGPGQVQASSYYVDRRAGSPQRTTYLTEYDCQGRRFRDVVFDGPVGSAQWQPVDPDPLNRAAMDFACAIAQTDQP